MSLKDALDLLLVAAMFFGAAALGVAIVIGREYDKCE